MASREGVLQLAEVTPMLARKALTLPSRGDWRYELKFDGYRMLASTTVPALKTRHGTDCTRWFPEVLPILARLPPATVLDGEIAVLDEVGRSDFAKLHARAKRRGLSAGDPLAVYCVFDLLALRGKDLRGLPFEARKLRLRKLLQPIKEGLLYVEDVDDGEWLYQAVLALQMEGVVAKRVGSPYVGGDGHSDWFKIKRPGATPPGRFRREV
ncbi:hypothetical protein [Cupriavidus sp. D39]|uniref:ATP-dependent DNA ligase n=1 Tax=Cupriavidus sp. D39 TaxID=2997877 RepID=UPI00226EE4E1|nr:hypothetical protein [Cupriavidus sp. D39]MCY0853077.1 hypothetical protein [Cupriavidus sp. D39]